jgi:hypothetical protein
MAELRETAPRYASRDGSELPRFAVASQAEVTAGINWSVRVRLTDLGDELLEWMGDPNIRVEWDDETWEVFVEPPVAEIRRQRDETQARLTDFTATAPILELDALRQSCHAMLRTLVDLHDFQLEHLAKLTPRAFADGLYQTPAAALQAGSQSRFDAFLASAEAAQSSSSSLVSELDRLLRART